MSTHHARRTPEIRAIHIDELDALKRLREVAFFDQMDWSDVRIRQHHSEMLRYRRGAFVDGELVSTASWLPFEVHVEGGRAAMGGLASVSTPLEHRRQGYVESLLHDGLTSLHDAGTGWSLEYPFDPGYYRRYGWACVPNGACFKAPPEWFASVEGARHAQGMRRVVWREERAEIDAIYEVFAARHTFSMVRNEEPRQAWSNMCEGAIWMARPPVLYMSEDAYVVCALDRGAAGMSVEVVDHGYRTAQGRLSIFGLLGGFDSKQVGEIEIQLPSTDPLTLSWGMRRMAQPEVLQARVVDVIKVLEQGGLARVAKPFAVRVHDAFCTWNDGVFEVTREGVQRCDVASKVSVVELDVSTLAQVVSGAMSVEALASLDAIKGDHGVLEQVRYTRPVYMSLADYF